MRFGKAFYCAAMRALCFRNRNVHREYCAQFTGGSIAVEVVVVVGMGVFLGFPWGPKRSALILSRPWPEAVRRSVAPSTKDVGPQTKQVGARFEGQVASAIRAASMRPGARGQSFGATRVYA